MDWTKLISIITSAIAVAFSLNSRLKKFNNERISVYKDMKSLASELKMEAYEIKEIDEELKKRILRETTGIFETLHAKRLLKVLSCNENLDPFNRQRLKMLIRCVNEKKLKPEDNCELISFQLSEDLYKKRAREGFNVILAMLFSFVVLIISGIQSFKENDLIWSVFQITMAFLMYVAMIYTKSEYPTPWNFKSHDDFINELNEYREMNEK